MSKGDEIVMIRSRRFVVVDCGKCGAVYTVPEIMYDSMRRDGGFAHCQNGHGWGWNEGTAQRDQLRAERDRLKQDAARLNDELSAARTEAANEKSMRLKAIKRAASGVCPCCNRTFTNVQRHMKTKHPNVVPLEQNIG